MRSPNKVSRKFIFFLGEEGYIVFGDILSEYIQSLFHHFESFLKAKRIDKEVIELISNLFDDHFLIML